MENRSKDLLHLEHKDSSSSLESTLLVCDKNGSLSQSKKPLPCGKPMTALPPASEVLGKVKDFLGVISEANERLQQDAKEKCREEYDIETLTGNESQYIEMDLMLGVADLHTPEAVAAAEFAMAGNQPSITLPDSDSEIELDESSSGTEESSSDEEDEDGTLSPVEKKEPRGVGSPDTAEKHRSKKRTKIVEVS